MKTLKPLSLFLTLVSVILMVPRNTAGRNPASGDIFLWEARIDSCTLYIAGTIHLGKADYYPPQETYLNYLKRSDLVVFEVPDDFEALKTKMFSYIQKDRLPEEKYFRHTLDSGTIAGITEILGTDEFHKFDRYNAWVLLTQLSVNKMKLLDYDPSFGVDRYLRENAAGMGKEIAGLECAEDQFRLFESDLPYDIQLKIIENLIRNVRASIEKEGTLYDAYLNNEPEEFGRIFRESYHLDNPVQKAVYDKIFTQRNSGWADRLEELASGHSGTVFVAVGAGHLFGPGNLLECLTDKGYMVSQVAP